MQNKTINFLIAVVAGLFYNIITLHLNPIPYGLVAVLLIGAIISGLIMIFKKDRSNWSSVFMWTCVIISILSSFGNTL